MTVGQLLTLTFGFLLASVFIFLFGMWVGRDMAKQSETRERPVVSKAVEAGIPSPGAPVEAIPTPTVALVDQRPTRPRPSLAQASATRTSLPTRTATIPQPTRTSPPRATRTSTHRPAATVVDVVWTVQVTATNEQVQALVVARSLRKKGYDAFTAQAEVAGVTWYRIQVGKFADKKKAEETAAKLRRDGQEAAFVDRIR